jgi:hypothetical protein
MNTHALLLSPCLGVCPMEAAESRHSNLFEAYFKRRNPSLCMNSRDTEVHRLFQKHSLLITNGIARDSFEAFKAFERAMKGLVRLADKEMDISNARAEAARCARETIATAEADEEIPRRLKLFAYATLGEVVQKAAKSKEPLQLARHHQILARRRAPGPRRQPYQRD